MRICDELKARLHHSSHEIGQLQQLLSTVVDHVQTVVDDVQQCSDRADLIDPAFNTLNRQIHALTEEMNRVYALRNNENDVHLRLENSQLRKELAALQEVVKSNEELTQHLGSLERFNQMLKSKLNEMKEMYENAIIEVADLKEKNKNLYNMAAFNVVTKTEASSNANSGNLAGQIPFGRTVVETNRGLTVTIESNSVGSPDKATLNQGWIPPIPSGPAYPFPDIIPEPHFTGLDPANAGSTQVAIRAPKSRPIVKGTKEAKESFERMKRALLGSPLTVPTNIIKADNNTTAPLSSPSAATPIATTKMSDPETPSNVKSKLNPAVAAFTPSHGSGQESAISGSAQTASPTKDESKASAGATDSKEEGFIPPHLRRVHNTSTKEKSVTSSEDLLTEDKSKRQDPVATSVQKESSKGTEAQKSPAVFSTVLPHLRRPNKPVKKENVPPPQVQHSYKGKMKEDAVYGAEFFSHDLMSTGMKDDDGAATTPSTFTKPDPGLQAWLDTQENAPSNNSSSQDLNATIKNTLIDIDPYSPEKWKQKATILPPGFIPFSANDGAPANTPTAAPIKTDIAISPATVFFDMTASNPTAQNAEAATEHKASTKAATEKERNAAFLAQYNSAIDSVYAKYGRDSSRNSSSEEKANETNPFEADPNYIPLKPSGTHQLGALLDAECRNMVLKPRAVKVEGGLEQEWKAVRKDGRIFYVL